MSIPFTQHSLYSKFSYLLFLEDSDPAFIKRAEKFILHEIKDPKQWLIVCYLGSEALKQKFPAHEIYQIGEISPEIDRLSWQLLAKLLATCAKEISCISKAVDTQQALEKSLMYLFIYPARCLATAELLKIERVYSITRWPHLYSRLKQNITPIAIDSPLRQYLKCTSPLVDTILYFSRCLKSVLSKKIENVAPCKIVLIGQYSTSLTTFAKILKSFPAKEIFFHIYSIDNLNADAKRKLQQQIESIKQLGWHWWVYQDRDILRAFASMMQVIFLQLKGLANQQAFAFYSSLIRTYVLIQRWQWEIDDLLIEIKPNTLITSQERDSLALGTIAIAKKHHCRVLNLFNGMIVKGEPLITAIPFDGWLIWGPYQASILEQLGVPTEQLFITGHMESHNWLASRDKRLQNQPIARKIITYFSQPATGFAADYRSVISHMLKSLLTKIDDIEIWIKPHPLEYDNISERFWKGIDRVTVHSKDIKPSALIPDSRLVIGINSTVLLEALIAGVPIAIYDPTELYQSFVQKGAALDLLNCIDPVQALTQLINNQEKINIMSKLAETAVVEHIKPLDNLAAERIAAVIQTSVNAG